jgi:hypothetical protein
MPDRANLPAKQTPPRSASTLLFYRRCAVPAALCGGSFLVFANTGINIKTMGMIHKKAGRSTNNFARSNGFLA